MSSICEEDISEQQVGGEGAPEHVLALLNSGVDSAFQFTGDDFADSQLIGAVIEAIADDGAKITYDSRDGVIKVFSDTTRWKLGMEDPMVSLMEYANKLDS